MAAAIETSGEEAMERLMEIAQQQQMSPHHNSDELTDRGRRSRDHEVGRPLAGDLPEIGYAGERQLHPLPENQLHQRLDNIDRSYAGYHSLRSLASVYVALSVLMAILAMLTSPSSVEISLFGMRTSQGLRENEIESSEIHHLNHAADASTAKLDDMRVAFDGYWNLEKNMWSNNEGWQSIVEHSKSKGSPLYLTERAEDLSKPQHHRPSPSSWTSTLLNIVSQLRDHFTEQFTILKLNFDAALILPHKAPSKSAEPALPSSSTKWTFPWDRMQGPTHRSGTPNDGSDQSDFNVKSQTLNIPGSVKNISLYSVLSAKYMTVDSSLRHLFMSRANDKNVTLSSPLPTFFYNVLTSTPRLVIMANLLLVFTCVIHAAVADFFLRPFTTMNDARNISAGRRHSRRIPDEVRSRRRAGQERFWGILMFKLLLVSVALEPTGIDLFILTSWYSFVSFLRSLSYLAGTTTRQAIQSGVPPSVGALHLLLLVLMCDMLAALGCAAVLHCTGWSMLFLLSCDCIILGADVVTHLLRYALSVKEEAHRLEISSLEEKQLALRALRMEQLEASGNHQGDETVSERPTVHGEEEQVDQGTHVDDDIAYEDELFHLDHMIESRELAYTSRLALIGTAAFSLEIFALCVSVIHLLHIWSLHGSGFGLVNWVLGLHLHSTFSSIAKKVSERRNALRVTQEINNCFPEASDKDIRKALAAGDVCCICLNSISFGSVKKVRCGHLFHANCLREVIERERSFAATKCPLCRTSMVADRRPPHVGQSDATSRLGSTASTDPTNEGDGERATNRQIERAQIVNTGEQSLLRISTENILPSWLPIPAFAFEVVRRDTTVIVEPNSHPEAGWLRFFRRGGQVQINELNNNSQIQQPEEQQETSFWRRLFIMIGAIPMSPEEEAVALDQLVDMFPQYDRADLLRELRARRSAESVAESILLGVFSGVPRGGG